MGDFNIHINSCMNSKWSHLVQLFDLTQLITEPTRVTQTSSTLIDHVYNTTPATTAERFVSQISLSDHFPVCFTRKMSRKLSKHQHTTTSYRCFKHFDEKTGFRPKHCCQSALIKVTDHWLKCIDEGDLIGTLFLDFRKAFDLVDHYILTLKAPVTTIVVCFVFCWLL